MRCNLTIKKGDKRTPHWGAILPCVHYDSPDLNTDKRLSSKIKTMHR